MNFYLIYGESKSVIDYEVNKILKKLSIPDVVKYETGRDGLEDVIEDISTVSMFSSKKVVILDDCYFLRANKNIDNIELLEDYFEHYNRDNYLIMICYSDKLDTRKKIYKQIKRQAKIVECKKGDKNSLVSFVQEYLSLNGYKMEDVSYFIEKVGSDLDNLRNELDKLFMYQPVSKSICNDDIDTVSVVSSENEIFDLTDAIILGRKNEALSLLEKFLKGDYEEIQIIMLLASQFRFLFQVKRLLNKNKKYDDISKILGVNPYRVKYTIKKLYAYSESMLVEEIKRLAKMDRDIKMGLLDKRLALELFIIKREQLV